MRWSLVFFGLVLLLTACARATIPSSKDTAPASTSVMTTTPAPVTESVVDDPDALVTLADQGCGIDQRVLAPGPITVELGNSTSDAAFFELVSIEGEYLELAKHVAEESIRLIAGEDMAGRPGYVTQVARMEVPAGSMGEMAASVEKGTYAVVCGNPGVSITVSEPFVVGDGPTPRG